MTKKNLKKQKKKQEEELREKIKIEELKERLNDKLKIEELKARVYELENEKNKIKEYQMLKDYMLDKGSSLSVILNRNGLTSSKYYIKWANLKYKRIRICHPIIPVIKTDEDFLSILVG